METNNDNDNNKFVNLSHVLLRKIIECLDETAFRIIFTLVCKKWYYEKNRYLFFQNDDDQPFRLPKAYSSIPYLLTKKKQLAIGSERDGSSHLITLDEFYNNGFQLNAETGCGVDMTKLFVDAPNADFEKLKTHLAYSNIKYMCIYSLRAPLVADCLPRGLVELYLYGYCHPVEIGHLPASLKRLELNTTHELHLNCNALPPHLEILNLDSLVTFSPTVEVSLPKSLKTINFCPIGWIKHLKHLTALETLSFNNRIIVPELLSPGDLPSSLTNLSLSQQSLKPGVIPSSIRILDIYFTVNLEDGLFPLDAHYERLSLLNVYSPIQPGQLPPIIKELDLQGYNQALVPGSLPEGIKVLKLPSLDASRLQPGVIPPSVRHVSLFMNHSNSSVPIHFNSMPQAIESLDFALYNNQAFKLDFTVLPDTLREITCHPKHINQNHTLDSIKETVTNITLFGNGYYNLHRIDKQHYIVLQSRSKGIKIMSSKEITNLLQKYSTYKYDSI